MASLSKAKHPAHAAPCWRSVGHEFQQMQKSMQMKIIQRYHDSPYGVALNGRQVGSGYEVVVKRKNDKTALINISRKTTARNVPHLNPEEPAGRRLEDRQENETETDN
jgi:hypothetical protein